MGETPREEENQEPTDSFIYGPEDKNYSELQRNRLETDTKMTKEEEKKVVAAIRSRNAGIKKFGMRENKKK